MRIPNASCRLNSLLVLALLPIPLWAQGQPQSPQIAVEGRVAALDSEMASTQLSELEGMHTLILSEPSSTERTDRLRRLSRVLAGLDVPGSERRISVLLSSCLREIPIQLAQTDDEVVKPPGTSYWHVYSGEDEAQGGGGSSSGGKGTQSYWQIDSSDDNDPVKLPSSYWQIDSMDDEAQGSGGGGTDPGPKGTNSYWDFEDRNQL